MNGLLARAVLAFLVLPGTVAFLIPWLLVEPGQSGQFVDARGLVPFVLGIVLLLWCVREFYVAGRGTLAPWSPPRHLVASGLYRFSRNPMYIAVVLVLWGWVLGFRSRAMAVYALLVMLAFHLRVILGEEPWLARAHGEEWIRYKAQVPRWFGFHRQNDSRTNAG
jgi:protein-S-isoprenylcysteine O-methyltransferase Ste14